MLREGNGLKTRNRQEKEQGGKQIYVSVRKSEIWRGGEFFFKERGNELRLGFRRILFHQSPTTITQTYIYFPPCYFPYLSLVFGPFPSLYTFIYIYIIRKHKSTKLNSSKYCYASVIIQLNISHLFTHI